MDPQANPSNAWNTRSSSWTPSQLQHVESELAKEYPNLPRRLIETAISEAQKGTECRQGTVRLLVRARKHLASDVLNSGPEGAVWGCGCQLPA